MQDPTDYLSEIGAKLLKLDPNAYTQLVVRGDGFAPAKDILENLRADELLSAPIHNRDDAQAMLAAMWLWFDWLDESHTISQKINTPTGSFWHAIMHRREGDFSNSKYWHARCASHPSLKTIAAQAPALVSNMPADKSLLKVVLDGWNPNGFVDLVEAVHDSPDDPRHAVAVALQKLEWRVLFHHCTRAAAGA